MPAKLAIVYLSPHINFQSTIDAVLRHAGKTKIVATMTAGELCSDGHDPRASLYCDASAPWDNVVIQIFSPELIDDLSIHAVPLEQESGSRSRAATSDEKVAQISAHLSRVTVPFVITARDTFAFTLIDGLAKAENHFAEAIYKSERFPCTFIGGSSAGKLDFRTTCVFDGRQTLRNHAVIAFVKLSSNFAFSIFKTQNFVNTRKSFIIAEADTQSRTARSVIDRKTTNAVNILDVLCNLMSCGKERIRQALEGHTFALSIEGELYIRSISDIDLDQGTVSFYADVSVGDELFLLQGTDFNRTTRSDLQNFLRGKPEPVGAILNDCILRRLNNARHLHELDGMWPMPVAGFSSFGEFLGINMNQTLTATVFFRLDDDHVFRDEFIEYFPINYGRFCQYFLRSRLNQQKILNDIRKNLIDRLVDFIQRTAQVSTELEQIVRQTEGTLATMGDVRNELENRMTSLASDDHKGVLEKEFQNVIRMTEELFSIVSIIEKISLQTNILSLNASVEAARVGQHGRGFAVIANEIRTLAHNTRESVTRSQKSLSGVKSSIGVLGTHIEQSEKKLATAQTDYGEISNRISNMFSSFEQINEVMHSVEEMSNQQAMLIRNVEQDILRLKKIEQ
ncbi:methyl-accepting chemotaxis protein [Gluconacetobacter takamatsuzukensis]|uniref:Histidine kinase n=1 Tax=Gluconacetobacter takamatsuzukensis TaxID=1286190 RepID=A0A7W4PR04_9PROT|nr:methyl-accepting chemotaxis protein [Gluconacetobacter takamatsuzukensis]MBB2205044.1 histidine kinase [Gluconacetobacter takamatsuzukensis]